MSQGVPETEARNALIEGWLVVSARLAIQPSTTSYDSTCGCVSTDPLDKHGSRSSQCKKLPSDTHGTGGSERDDGGEVG